jgi:hypothetical protein
MESYQAIFQLQAHMKRLVLQSLNLFAQFPQIFLKATKHILHTE